MNLRPHVVKQGEYLTQLSHRYGFDATEVWNHSKNEEIRRLRRDMDILATGDIVFIPDRRSEGLPFRAGTVNRFMAKVSKVPVNLRFVDLDRPMANERFVVEGGATPAEGTTDGAGRVKLMVPVHVSEVRVIFPERDLDFHVKVGHIDPIEERSGIASRLAHLGYLPSAENHHMYAQIPGFSAQEDRMRLAVQEFQRTHGLEPTGIVDEVTRDALQNEHGI